MDESFAPHDAIDKETLAALCRRSDARGLARLVGHAGLLSATGWVSALAVGGPWAVPASILHGAVLVFLFAPLHETIHRTAFRARWLNDALAWACGAVLVLPPAYFRAFHFALHRHTQDPGKDPELATPKPASLAEYVRYASGLPYWRRQIGGLLRHAAGRVGEPFIPARQRPAIVREARLLLGAYLGLAAGSLVLGTWAAVVFWVVPALLGQPALRLYLLAEHTGCPLVPDMLRNTRTTRSNPAVRWLAWNMPYHVAHHAYPAVPFHALPAVHEHLERRIAALAPGAPGYLAVHRGLIAALGRPPSAPAQP